MGEILENSSCQKCEDYGYITGSRGRWAHATICSCKNPCPICAGSGWTYSNDEAGRNFATPCECKYLHERVTAFVDARLPAAYHNKTVESFEAQTANQQKVKRWFLEFQERGRPQDRGVLVTGNPGVGKTHLLCGILRFLVLEGGMACRYVDSFQLLQDLKASFESGGGSSQLMESITSVEILGLDELGKTRTSGWQREVLDQIISRRYDTGLTTFITSNYDFKTREPADQTAEAERLQSLVKQEPLKDRIGSRIFSRIMEMCKPLVIDGQDRRITGS